MAYEVLQFVQSDDVVYARPMWNNVNWLKGDTLEETGVEWYWLEFEIVHRNSKEMSEEEKSNRNRK